MADQPHPLRVLQLIGDTDPTASHLGALELHRRLADVGVEVRTLALAPGRQGGLDDTVPVMAPARRSWTIRRVLDREARWADVSLVHAPGALVSPARRRAGRPPVVAVLFDPGDEAGAASISLEGVDELVVVSSGAGGDATSGGGVTRLVEPVTAETWRELLSDCAVRCA